MTVAEALAAGSEKLGGDTSGLDAEVLLAHVLGCDRTWLLAHPESPLRPDHWEHFRSLVVQRASGRPVAHLVGYREFYGRQFQVNRSVLVPRPDSELLVELALSRVAAGDTVVDVGTGSGCLGITVALERPDLDVRLVDLSAVALSLAADNAARLGASQVRLHRADLWPELGLDPSRTVVMANLPYVPDGQVEDDQALRHEPTVALAGGVNGTEVITRFLAELDRRGFQPRTLLLEHGPDQADAIAQLVTGSTQTHPDLAGRPRVTEISAAPAATPVAPEPSEG